VPIDEFMGLMEQNIPQPSYSQVSHQTKEIKEHYYKPQDRISNGSIFVSARISRPKKRHLPIFLA
jgi:hypothetical protein